MNEQLITKPVARTVSSPVTAPLRRRTWIGEHRSWLGLSAAIVLVVGAGATWWSLGTAPTVHYTTVVATRGVVARTVSATGTVNPELTIIVGSYVSGVIQSLSCDYNTKVKAGQVCARIDPRPYQSLVDQAKANLDVAKAQLGKDKALLAYTKINVTRRDWLVAHDSETKDVADLARSAYDQAQAQIGLDQATIEQHQAQLDAAIINLGYADIISPVDGTVVSRNVTQGQTVAASFQTPTLFLIATDLTKMQVDTNVSESDIGGVKEGNKATFTVDAYPARVFAGKVTQLRQSPQTVQNVVTYDAVIGVANLDLTLKPGLTASTRIIVNRRDDVLRVPNQALRYAPGSAAGGVTSEASASTGAGGSTAAAKASHVWILRDGKPVSLLVVPGLDDDNFTEIVSGDLKAGDQVIVAATTTAKGGAPAVAVPRL
jgi:HlyD family secretion protein